MNFAQNGTVRCWRIMLLLHVGANRIVGCWKIVNDGC